MGIKERAEIKRIEILLDKYWNGDTMVEEESELKKYFNQEKVAPHLQYIQPMFQALKKREKKRLDEKFDQRVLSSIGEKKQGSSYEIRPRKVQNLLKIAAVFIIVILSAVIYRYYPLNSGIQTAATAADTFENPEEAYAQLKKSLLLVSVKLNSGNEFMDDLNKLNAGASLFNKQKEIKNQKEKSE